MVPRGSSWSSTRAGFAGCPTRTSTAATTPRMPDASATRPARLGLGARIFVAATLSVVGVLGVTLGLTSLQANRTADESIRRALAGVRRGVQAFLTGRTAAYAIDDALAQQIKQSTTTDVVFFALDTLNHPYIVGSTLPRETIEPALAADTAAIAALPRDTAGTELAAVVDGERLIGLASPI